MEYYVSDKPLLENEEFSIYGVTDFTEYANEVMRYMLMSKENILSYFGLDHYDKVRINLYDTKENLLNWRTQLGTPPYQIGRNAGFFNLNDNMVFCYSDFSKVDRISAIKNIAHEFTHLVYMNSVQERGNNTRIVWLDEGLAQFLSGQKDDLLNNDRFKMWFMNRIVGSNKELPDISFLKQHGSKYGSFCDTETNKYNGYDISYVLIRYMNETLSKNEFQTIIRSKNLIEQLEDNLIYSAVSYYANEFGIETKLTNPNKM